MIHKKSSHLFVFFVLVIVAVGCSASPTPASIVPASTSVRPTMTSTLIPPTSTLIPPTSTPNPPTTTSTSIPPTTTFVAKLGHWAGEPSVSFDVTSDGKVRNFKMIFPMANGECHFDIEEVAIAEDDTFVYENLMASDQLDKALLDFVKIVSGEPEIAKTDSGNMIVLQRITGKFDGADTLSGTGKIWICETNFDGSTSKGIEWKAQWKTP